MSCLTVKLQPESDSDNSYPEPIEFEIDREHVVIVLSTGRRITLNASLLERIVMMRPVS